MMAQSPSNGVPKKGMNSLEAAALYLSDGQTSDPAKANALASGNPWDMDALQRSHLRRMMGFDFEIQVNEFENYIKVWSTDGSDITCVNKYDGTFSEESVDLLVNTCLEVKTAWDAQQAKKSEAVEGEIIGDDEPVTPENTSH